MHNMTVATFGTSPMNGRLRGDDKPAMSPWQRQTYFLRALYGEGWQLAASLDADKAITDAIDVRSDSIVKEL